MDHRVVAAVFSHIYPAQRSPSTIPDESSLAKLRQRLAGHILKGRFHLPFTTCEFGGWAQHVRGGYLWKVRLSRHDVGGGNCREVRPCARPPVWYHAEVTFLHAVRDGAYARLQHSAFPKMLRRSTCVS